MGWSVEDFTEMIDAADLPEAKEVLAAWWEPVADSGHACGMVVQLIDGTTWYLECLQMDGQTTYAKPSKVKVISKAPRSKLYVSSLSWNVGPAPVTAELDVIYCRSRP